MHIYMIGNLNFTETFYEIKNETTKLMSSKKKNIFTCFLNYNSLNLFNLYCFLKHVKMCLENIAFKHKQKSQLLKNNLFSIFKSVFDVNYNYLNLFNLYCFLSKTLLKIDKRWFFNSWFLCLCITAMFFKHTPSIWEQIRMLN